MVAKIRSKIRAIADQVKSTSQPFEYTTSNDFPLTQDNVIAVSEVTINDNDLTSGQDYSYDATNNIVTVTAVLASKDIVRAFFTYYNYSDTELSKYIEYALIQLSINNYLKDGEPYRIDSLEIYPVPDEKDMNLIAFIAGILIKPSLSRYSLPTVTVHYPEDDNIDRKISKVIEKFKKKVGVWDTITL
jgi:hypothetical protein